MTSKRDPLLRKLTPLDASAALQLSTEAGWNQTGGDWRTLIELSPDGCIGIEVENALAATATLVCYGRRLAWIGMVLTRKSFQGRGFAKRLLGEALRLADRLGIETVKLDATDEGQPIYEKLGFRGEQPVERWERAPSEESPRGSEVSAILQDEILRFDEHAFGVNRSALLRVLSQRSSSVVCSEGFLLARPGRVCRYLGPCVANTLPTAHTLINRALVDKSSSGWYWDLLTSNEAAVAFAHEVGFTPKRRLLRMVRGKEIRGREENIYALAGFEFG
jgi:GNAT superfamily N-acetyltransferase